MGVYWRIIMPLLSTLAALVIIVHSAEEDLEEYRRDLRPRILDAGTTKYDLPWRAVKAEPMITQSTQSDTWDGSPEDPPKRRRPLRKRRRRPQGAPELSQERYLERRQHRYYKDNNRPLTEMPNRRRKKTDVKHNNWYDEPIEKERPLRVKTQKRRPEQEPWHEFSEFGDIPADENLEINVGNQKHEISNYETEIDNSESREPRLTLNQFYNEERNRNVEATGDITDEENEDEPSQFTVSKYNEYEEHSTPEIKEDKSLSEFSLESSPPVRISRNKINEESQMKEIFNDIKEQKKALDPVTLKDILKQSNGKSLSELLQQHNLTLADLLNGEKSVLSLFRSTDAPKKEKENDLEETYVQSNESSPVTIKTQRDFDITTPIAFNKVIDNKIGTNNLEETNTSVELISTMTTYTTPGPVTIVTSKSNVEKYKLSNIFNNNYFNETNRTTLRRRFPSIVRMKLRMRPESNSSYKGQLSRDMIALTTKRYEHNKNLTRWKELIPMKNINKTLTKLDRSDEVNDILTTTTEEITTAHVTSEFNTISTQGDNDFETDTTIANTETTTTFIAETTTEIKIIPTLKTTLLTRIRQRPNVTSLRQQAFANRLKNKKLKQKPTNNETSQDHSMKDIFDMANLVSASEFIAKIQPTTTTSSNTAETETTLEDFITTETTFKTTQTTSKPSKTRKKSKSTTPRSPGLGTGTTEETAKFEIEEILNDTSTSAKLKKILMERNMTLNELVKHRERGSSHIHLADIFHNASKEPNPPEPFLSKSLIEPISKKTYPLRALLEANSHESTAKPLPTVPYLAAQYINIPIIMGFGNNINENRENSGINSLFNNFTNDDKVKNTNDPKNNTYDDLTANEKVEKVTNRTSRQSRIMGNESDIVTLNEIFSLIERSHNITNDMPQILENETTQNIPVKKVIQEEDVDGDGLIALADLQHINERNTGDKIEHYPLDSLEAIQTYSIPETIQNNTRSVTIVTASIVGLIAVLFLLTYAAFKWKHQQQLFRKKHCMSEEQIPSPVFENRTINKNGSMRSMSPMLSSNIYSVNTLEKPNSNECSEYMWDSLRKPF
ncbi:TNF receptor-associated factor family protein DDB_G0272098-like [Battus philenor]|uniref:TNF receptor-associated factor family protein DDB_G0272098-like n=1 Tax=Battus philenor TaxID=42288 RepID=UPI0035CEAACD